MQVPAIQTPSVEVALRSAPAGLTIKGLVDATGLSETTIRRKVAELKAAGQIHKMPSMDGALHIWGPKPDGRRAVPVTQNAEEVAPRRREAYERDMKVLEVLRVNERISCNEIARILNMPDIDQDGWSQLTYLSLRRLRKKGYTQREIVWEYTGPKEDLDSIEA